MDGSDNRGCGGSRGEEGSNPIGGTDDQNRDPQASMSSPTDDQKRNPQAVVSSPIDGTGDQNRDPLDAVVSSPIDGTDDQKRESLTTGISSSSPIGSTEGQKCDVDAVAVDSRDVSINVQVAHGLSLHDVSAPAEASFGTCLSLPSKRNRYFRYISSPRLSRRCWVLLQTFASFASRIYLWFASVGGLVVWIRVAVRAST